MGRLYADVIIDVSTDSLDHPFTYIVPESMVSLAIPGCQVTVPLRSREVTGFVIDIHDSCELPDDKLKEIIKIDNKLVAATSKLLRLAFWIKETYPCRMQQAIKCVLPVKKKIESVPKRNIHLIINREELIYYINTFERKKQAAKVRLLTALLENSNIPLTLARDKLGISTQTLNSLRAEGIVDLVEVVDDKAQVSNVNPANLNADQKAVVDTVTSDFASNRKPFLLYGVTGSGKTVCYIEMAKACVASGRSVIVLIPEISLTYQTLIRFYEAFGNRVGVINSKLSDGEKYATQMKAKEGELDVVIGPRSALFTPFENLGLIIIDEEHESSYKSETVPKYSAINTAAFLATLHQATLVLGSATPSVESFYRAKRGEYTLLTLKSRAKGKLTDDVKVVDLREELKNGNRSIFSDELAESLKATINNKKQAMLFINRRGIAGFVSCRACGHVFKCPHCDVSLSEHMSGRLTCHYCGYTEKKPQNCPECGSKYVYGFKAGTEAVETKLKELIPEVKTLRMDRDTTKAKGDYERILTSFYNHEADVLIGTQMIVKGHDFENVALVGVLAADLSLHTGDYTAAERTFDLLAQAVGRAGRGEGESKAVIQTYDPEHYAIKFAASQDYEGFYGEEILFRELAGYPPAEHLMMVSVLSKNNESAKRCSELLADEVKKKSRSDYQNDIIQILGPTAARIEKIKDVYRYVFYMKHADSNRLRNMGTYLENYVYAHHLDADITFDFDPINTL